MRWASAATTGEDLPEIVEDVTDRVRARLGDGPVDLAFLFVGAEHLGRADDVLARVRARLGEALVVGCGAGGVIGGGRELEHQPAVSLLAGRLPGVGVHAFQAEAPDLPDPDAPPRAWHALVGVSPADRPAFVLLGDPFTMPVDRLLDGLDFAYPASVKVGGLASAARRAGEQVLFCGDRVLREGSVGVALMGDVELVPAVAQGCRGVGTPMRITGCDGHLLRALDGLPVLDALQRTFAGASDRDRELATQALFLGFEMDPFHAHADDGPWLIRNLLGVDSSSRGLFVGEELRAGRRVRFHVRDRQTSHEDLERTLRATPPSAAPAAALLFSCLGRGRHLYGMSDHDSRVFDARYADVPLGGFFCSGEIGPVGRTTHLHGYTSSFGLICPARTTAEEGLA